MGLLSSLFGRQSDEEIAEEYLWSLCPDENDISSLVRHYDVGETARIVEQFSGARVTREQTTRIVQDIRNHYGMGPIDEWNMPGYEDPDAWPETREEERRWNDDCAARDAEIEAEQRGGGFLGWLFGR